MKKLLRRFNEQDLEDLSQKRGVVTFEVDRDLLKANEIPRAAFVVLEGDAIILKKDEGFLKLGHGYAMGFKELLENLPSKFHCRALKNLKAIILSRMDVESLSSQ